MADRGRRLLLAGMSYLPEQLQVNSFLYQQFNITNMLVTKLKTLYHYKQYR